MSVWVLLFFKWQERWDVEQHTVCVWLRRSMVTSLIFPTYVCELVLNSIILEFHSLKTEAQLCRESVSHSKPHHLPVIPFKMLQMAKHHKHHSVEWLESQTWGLAQTDQLTALFVSIPVNQSSWISYTDALLVSKCEVVRLEHQGRW